MHELFTELRLRGNLSNDWMAPRVRRIDDVEGDADTLIERVAAIRTYTYVAQRGSWLAEPTLWRERTRQVEDRLSDALHETLVRRFVDEAGHRKRHRRKPGGPSKIEARRAGMDDDAPKVDPNHPFAGLLALRSKIAPEAHLETPLHPLERVVDAPKTELSLDERGHVSWDGRRLGHLVAGPTVTTPEAKVDDLGELPGALKPRLRARLVAYGRELVRDLLAPLSGLDASTRPPEIRGLAYALTEGLGSIRAGTVARVEGHDGLLNARGIVQGQRYTYVKVALRPEALQRRATLLAVFRGKPATAFDPTATTLPLSPGLSREAALLAGYVIAGPRMVRVDVVERILALAATGEISFVKWLARPEPEALAIVAALLGPAEATAIAPCPPARSTRPPSPTCDGHSARPGRCPRPRTSTKRSSHTSSLRCCSRRSSWSAARAI